MDVWNIVSVFFSTVSGIYEKVGDMLYSFFFANGRAVLDIIHAGLKSTFDVLLVFTILVTLLFTIIAIYVYFKKPKEETPVHDDLLPKVTIQIPTYNELAALNCARRCLEFDYPKSKFEIIIGDDSSDKAISKKIDAFANLHPGMVKVTRRGSNAGFKPGNLNHMLKSTKGDYIVVFDSDFLPKEDFLRRIMAPFILDEDVAAVQARWVIKNFSQNIFSIVGGTIPMFSHHVGLPFLEAINSTGFIAGSAEAIRKKDLIESGGWTAGSLTEDIDYSLRLTKAGKKIKYLPDLHCECEAPFTMRDLSKQQMRWAYGVITAFKTHFFGILTSKKSSFKKSINVYILVLGYLVTLMFFTLASIGTLSIFTARPAPIDWVKFFTDFGRNLLLTSGFLLTSILTLKMAKRTHEIPKMILASFTVGLVVIFNVTSGIFKAIFDRPMRWFMLNKNGNTVQLK